jgi:hypothetical protein
VDGEERRDDAERDTEELVGEVQPRTFGGDRLVQRRGRLGEATGRGQFRDQRDERVDGRSTQRDGEYEQHLGPPGPLLIAHGQTLSVNLLEQVYEQLTVTARVGARVCPA